ncbi:MarR family winged helix-turn-helix transcriptional regulator [Sphingomonas colocasiae]|uniref:MarR family transcriptional regulator n=1 Tax=Sphingomonas colocasiae TaxID=1848973 RepID=A0ABS7PSQ4_9SPHN|nr:MarR family transcriptional regulator [Sphingomonas colocasiae]MBY8824323.1 MarR family transcriptional regulator [Sphingomonas colocasiae]
MDQPRRTHLGFRIGRVARLLRLRHEARAKQMGLTPAQMHALSVVRYNEGRSQRSIAETLDVGEVTAGRLICRLEANGWVERRPDRHDGRVMRVYLGKGAAGVLRKLDEIAMTEEREALTGMNAADIDHLLLGLDAISANLGRPIDLSIIGDEN